MVWCQKSVGDRLDFRYVSRRQKCFETKKTFCLKNFKFELHTVHARLKVVIFVANFLQRTFSNHEKVETWERHQVRSELSEVSINWSLESKRACDTRANFGNQCIHLFEIRILSDFQHVLDVHQSFVVNHGSLIRVFKKLMGWKNSVVSKQKQI